MNKYHHFVPRFYLNFFTDEHSGKLSQYLLNLNKTIVSRPDNIGGENYFYTADNKNGSKDNSMESLFALVESDCAPALKNCIARPHSLSNLDKEWLIQFISLQFTRVPSTMNYNESLQQAFYHNEIHKLAKDPHRIQSHMNELKNNKLSEDEIKEMLLNSNKHIDITIPKQMIFASILKSYETIFPILFAMKWKILRAVDDSYFVTCDNPVVSFLGNNKNGIVMSGGFANKRIIVTFPLSNHLCLSGSWFGKGHFDVINVKSTTVKRINFRTIGLASEFVYANKINQELTDDILKTIDLKKKFKEQIDKDNQRNIEKRLQLQS